jgi:hypothetical protein
VVKWKIFPNGVVFLDFRHTSPYPIVYQRAGAALLSVNRD